MRDAGEAITTVRIVMECLITREIKLNTTLLTSEAFTMPDGFTATELLVFIDGLSTTTTFVDTIGVDDRAVHGIASCASLTISSDANTVVGDTSMVTRSAINGVLASSAKKQTFMTRVTEEVGRAKVLLALIANEAVKVVVLCAYNLIQQGATLLLADRANNV